MEFFRIRKDIPFMQRALLFNAISLLTFIAAVFFLLHRGLHLSVEFTGGTVIEVINHAITSTMSRTIITHGCTQMMVLSMFLFGGPTLHYFALALTVGILFGIYSSVFVAAALAMWLGVKRDDLIKEKKERHDPSDPNAGAQV